MCTYKSVSKFQNDVTSSAKLSHYYIHSALVTSMDRY